MSGGETFGGGFLRGGGGRDVSVIPCQGFSTAELGTGGTSGGCGRAPLGGGGGACLTAYPLFLEMLSDLVVLGESSKGKWRR